MLDGHSAGPFAPVVRQVHLPVGMIPSSAEVTSQNCRLSVHTVESGTGRSRAVTFHASPRRLASS